MDFRTTYGTLLRTQIDMYARMYEIMEKMEEYDSTTTVGGGSSNLHTINTSTMQLERLVVQLDETFEKANESMERIEHMSELCQQIVSHPVYMRVLELHVLAEARVREVIGRQ
jgi:transcriptional regulator of NAD metabolism